jgi:hypothetical protein
LPVTLTAFRFRMLMIASHFRSSTVVRHFRVPDLATGEVFAASFEEGRRS